MLIKTRKNAYDGRGNVVVSSDSDIRKALKLFKDQALYCEQFVNYRKELAVMVARNRLQETAVYPVVETSQLRNICIEVVAPADIDQAIFKTAERLALQVVKHLHGNGVFGIEMFLSQDDQLLINEVAPRVHNSGHYTIEACGTSQFTQHIRAITETTLGPTSLLVPAAAMVNILGERDGPTEITGLDRALTIPSTYVHLYGKTPTKIDRKMGHITSTGNSTQQALDRARQARSYIGI